MGAGSTRSPPENLELPEDCPKVPEKVNVNEALDPTSMGTEMGEKAANPESRSPVQLRSPGLDTAEIRWIVGASGQLIEIPVPVTSAEPKLVKLTWKKFCPRGSVSETTIIGQGGVAVGVGVIVGVAVTVGVFVGVGEGPGVSVGVTVGVGVCVGVWVGVSVGRGVPA